MKTLDREYLSTHPKGDEKAKLTFSGTLPAFVPVPLNQDGTRASAGLQVTADNYMEAFSALNAIQEDGGEQLLWELLEQVVTEEEAASVESPKAAAEFLRGRANEVVVPFRTFTVEMTVQKTDSFGAVTESDVVFELTAPSINSGAALALEVSRPQALTQVMIGLSPQTEDEDAQSGDEVLVIS